MPEKAQRRQHALDRADQLGGWRRPVGVGLAQGQEIGQEFHDRHRIARYMAAVGQDLAVEFRGKMARRAAQRRGRCRQRHRRIGKRDTGPQPALALRHLPHHRAQIADLRCQRPEECPVEAQFGALQNHRGVLQPGDDALGRRLRVPRRPADAAAMGRDPVGHQGARIGGGEFGVGGAHVAQPAEAVQRLLPALVCDIEQEGRPPRGLDQTTGQRKAAMVDFEGNLRVGNAEVRRRDQHALGRAAAVAPAIERPRAQATPRPAPIRAGDERPQTPVVGRRCRQDLLPSKDRFGAF